MIHGKKNIHVRFWGVKNKCHYGNYKRYFKVKHCIFSLSIIIIFLLPPPDIVAEIFQNLWKSSMNYQKDCLGLPTLFSPLLKEPEELRYQSISKSFNGKLIIRRERCEHSCNFPLIFAFKRTQEQFCPKRLFLLDRLSRVDHLVQPHQLMLSLRCSCRISGI